MFKKGERRKPRSKKAGKATRTQPFVFRLAPDEFTLLEQAVALSPCRRVSEFVRNAALELAARLTRQTGVPQSAQTEASSNSGASSETN